MKTLKTKLFISLSLVATVIVACFAAAYTINIGNQETYGTLNLGKLLLWRSSETGTGIEIDGSTYTIKVGTRAGTNATSQIYVSEICGRTGDNCKLVSELVSVGSNNLSGGGYCKYVAEVGHYNHDMVWVVDTPAHFECTTTNPYTLPVASANVTGGIRLYTALENLGDKEYAVKLNSGKAYVKVPWTDNHYTGTLTIKGGSATGLVFFQTGDSTLTITGGGNISVTTDTSNHKITLSGTDTDTHYTGTLTIKGGGKTGITFNQNSGAQTLYITGGGGITVTTGSSAGYIIISGAAGGGDSLWTKATDDGTIIKPNSNQNLFFTNATTLYHEGTLNIQKSGNNISVSNGGCTITPNQISFDGKGLRVGTTSCYSGAGISTVGTIALGNFGNNGNNISIFASGSNQNANYEILGNQRLLIGTYSGNYIFFDKSNNIGINTTTTKSTLTVKGSIQVGNCGTATCTGNTVGQIRYRQASGSSTGQFVGCIKVANGYKWVPLSNGNDTGVSVSNDTNCSSLSIPYSINSYTTTEMGASGR